MCGIVAYVGNKNAIPILLKGLERLEYRGYDSAGIAILNGDNNIHIFKKKKIDSKYVKITINDNFRFNRYEKQNK